MVSAFIVDLMALIRQLTEIPKTYEGLTGKILESLPIGYSRVAQWGNLENGDF